jgi:hypothetical protein
MNIDPGHRDAPMVIKCAAVIQSVNKSCQIEAANRYADIVKRRMRRRSFQDKVSLCSGDIIADIDDLLRTMIRRVNNRRKFMMYS